MFLPIGDEPNPRMTPVVNYLLIAANVAVFVLISLPLSGRPADPNDPLARAYLESLVERFPRVDPRALWAQVSAYDLFLYRWGFRPGSPSIATLFTSMFLHGSFLHLFGNMLFLWIYGDNAEHRLGRFAYLAVYLLTGVVAAVSFGAVVGGASRDVPMVGASGAISGALGLYFVWFPRNRVRVFVFLFPFLMDVWKIPARIVLGFFLLFDNLLPFLIDRQGAGGVAHGAHIGGFIAGVGIALAVNVTGRARQERSARRVGGGPERPIGAVPGTARTDGAAPARGGAASVGLRARDGDIAGAIRGYLDLTHLERRAVPLEVTADLGDRLAMAGDLDAALALYRHALEDHPLDAERARAFLGIGQALLEQGRPTAAYQYLLDALDADPSPDVEMAARQAIARIAAMQKFGRRG
jgi:membrane associated rhomboid family serine protease